jgi:tRNA(adenine34) deaminase
MTNIFSSDDHSKYMGQALKQAQKAYDIDEVPIGAVIVSPEGKIIGRAYNLVEKCQQQTAHAEIRAIEKACKKMSNWRLEGCWLYVTLEPCSMCMNLILMSRMQGIVFGAKSPIFGYHLDNSGPLQVYRRDTLHIIGGIGEQEASALLKKFFKQKRKSKSE